MSGLSQRQATGGSGSGSVAEAGNASRGTLMHGGATTNDTYRLRLDRSGSRYTGSWSLKGASWRRLGRVVNRKLAAGGLRPGRARAGPAGSAALCSVRAVPRALGHISGASRSQRCGCREPLPTAQAEPGESEEGDAEDDREPDPETAVAGGDRGDVGRRGRRARRAAPCGGAIPPDGGGGDASERIPAGRVRQSTPRGGRPASGGRHPLQAAAAELPPPRRRSR